MNQTYPYGLAPMDNPANLAGMVICTVMFFACFISAFWIVISRDSKIVRQSQPAAGFLALFSLCLLDGSVLIALGRPMNEGLCVGRLWGAQLAMFTLLSSYIMKGWTLFRYAQGTKSAIVRLTEDRGLYLTIFFILVFSIILILWTVLEPLSVVVDGTACKSAGRSAEIATIFCLCALWMFWLFFASQTYHLKTRLTERAHITCLVTGLAGVMSIVSSHAALDSVFTPDIRFLTEATCAGVVSATVILLSIVPKLCASDELFHEDDFIQHSEQDKDTARQRKARRRGTSASTLIRTSSMKSIRSTIRSTRSTRSTMSSKGKKKSRKDKTDEKRSPSAMRSSTTVLGHYQPQPADDEEAHAYTSQRRTVTFINPPESQPVAVYNPPPSFNEMGDWL